jgi:hypothetical protein
LQKEEVNILLNLIKKQDSIKPDDFKLNIMSEDRLELRKNTVKNIVDYTRLLKSLFERDYQGSITKNADIFYKNIDSININHKNFLTDKETGALTAIVQALPEIITYSKRRSFGLKLMREMQPVLEKFSLKVKDELKSVKVLIDNYYSKEFMENVSAKWPDKESKRLKYSKLGMKIIAKQNKIKSILEDLINAMDYIPKTHRELREALKKNKNPMNGLRELINFAYRINETYREFAKIED